MPEPGSSFSVPSMKRDDCPRIEPHPGHWRHTRLENAKVTAWCDGGQPRSPETDRILSHVIGAEPLTAETREQLADLLSV